MRKLLNTLYVTTPKSFLARDGENVIIRIEDDERFRIPVHTLEGIISFGYPGASPGLISLCAERNVGLCFLTEYGKFLGRVSGKIKGNVLLRRQQYRWADEKGKSLELARLFIAGKIINCRSYMMRVLREHEDVEYTSFLEDTIDFLLTKQKQALIASDLDNLRGIEGEAAKAYFDVFNYFIVSQKGEFMMVGRTRRPPKDKVNALLSFVYVLLAHEVQSALESVGLDPYVGFLHVDRPGRISLALDMMEEFRPYLADRLVISLINKKQVQGKGFIDQSEFGINMDDNTRKEVLRSWQQRKQENIKHPFLQETIPIGLLPYVQALLMARHIRGDLEQYPVFISK